ncbi:serine/threonine phosphatase [Escherichia phage TrudiGerster]|uniref:Serine/threonine phosphatase n=1 Tax=Escherichia phage TrudiGerster TaxID=2851991 RepID=A0AAE7VZU0_9CAUD|nr:serine/threonine phosphatase [Escherichia phage TrudiGerster]
MKVKFWSDLHLDHPGTLRFRPWFKNMKEHDEYILDTLSKHIGKRTKLVLLGDIAVGREGLAKLKSVIYNVPNQLILGNHDAERQGLRIKDLVDVYDDIQALGKQTGGGKKFWLSHCPLHEAELRGKVNIHGHVHTNSVRDQRYINVSFEMSKTPITLEDIVSGKYQTWNKIVDPITGVVSEISQDMVDILSKGFTFADGHPVRTNNV